MVETENIGGRRKVIFDPGGDPGISISSEDNLFYFGKGKSFPLKVNLSFSLWDLPVE
jgi:hypothetical protein